MKNKSSFYTDISKEFLDNFRLENKLKLNGGVAQSVRAEES